MSISTVDPTGLGVYDFDMTNNHGVTQADAQPRLDSLRTLAANTGGLAVVSTNDLRTPLRRLADQVSSYYLLTYYSTDTKFDGKFRKIDVKVKTPRVNVTARKGYTAPTDEMFVGDLAAAR